MQIGQLILLRDEWIEHLAIIDPLGEAQPALVAGARVHFGEAFVQPAIFARQHLLHLRIVECSEHPVEIAAKTQCHRHRLVVAAQRLNVEQSGEKFVDRIKRRPRAIQIEPTRADVTAHDFGKNLLAIDNGAVLALALKRADIAGSALFLRDGEFIDDIIRALARLHIASLGMGERECGEIMAKRMAGDRIAFPPAIDFTLRLQPCIQAKIV